MIVAAAPEPLYTPFPTTSSDTFTRHTGRHLIHLK